MASPFVLGSKPRDTKDDAQQSRTSRVAHARRSAQDPHSGKKKLLSTRIAARGEIDADESSGPWRARSLTSASEAPFCEYRRVGKSPPGFDDLARYIFYNRNESASGDPKSFDAKSGFIGETMLVWNQLVSAVTTPRPTSIASWSLATPRSLAKSTRPAGSFTARNSVSPRQLRKFERSTQANSSDDVPLTVKAARELKRFTAGGRRGQRYLSSRPAAGEWQSSPCRRRRLGRSHLGLYNSRRTAGRRTCRRSHQVRPARKTLLATRRWVRSIARSSKSETARASCCGSSRAARSIAEHAGAGCATGTILAPDARTCRSGRSSFWISRYIALLAPSDCADCFEHSDRALASRIARAKEQLNFFKDSRR